MTFTLIESLQDCLNNKLVRAVEQELGFTFTDHHDLVEGVPLSAYESTSVDEYFGRNLFKKIEDDLGFDPRARTIRDAIEHVHRTREMSLRFNAIVDENPVNLMKVMSVARNILHNMFRDFDIFKVHPRYTTGATERLKRGEDLLTRAKDSGGYATLKRKFNTVEFAWLVSSLPHVENNVSRDYTYFESVPKTAKVDRPIGYHEPMVLAVQAGIGDYIESRMRRYTGINIQKAEAEHRAYAWYSSLAGEYCTLDQSNASQNILRAHCRYLLPTNLFDVISKVCPSTLVIDGESYHHEMMAAQGNGLIFPLQTAIFYALIKACAKVKGIDGDILQYGDDSIFRVELFDTVCSVFTTIGMEVNREKSFATGSIRESCGGDYHNGKNIRPFYVSKLPQNSIDWYHVCNGIYRMGYLNHNCDWRSASIKRLWLRCISYIRSDRRFFGPVDLGDSVLTCNNIEWATFNQQGSKIRTLGVSFASEGGSFGQLSQGLPGNVVFKALANPLFGGSGWKAYSKYEIDMINKKLPISRQLTEGAGRYPSILGPRDTKVTPVWINYPLSVVSNHNNVDSIFDSLNIGDSLAQRARARREASQFFIINVLKKVIEKKKAVANTIVDITL